MTEYKELLKEIKMAIGLVFIPDGIWNINEDRRMERAAQAALDIMQSEIARRDKVIATVRGCLCAIAHLKPENDRTNSELALQALDEIAALQESQNNNKGDGGV